MKKKVSKVKYSLQEIDNFCPECHKHVPNKVDGKYFIPASLEGWGDSYTNTCPYCGYSFDHTTFIMFPHIQQFLPDMHPAIVELFDSMFFTTINANDFYPCCCDDEELENCIIQFYFYLTFIEKMNPANTLSALIEWHRGELGWAKKVTKELKQIRKLTGWEWFPQEYKRES